MKRIHSQIATVVDTMEELTEHRTTIEKMIDDQLDAVIAAAEQRKLDLKKDLNQIVQQKMKKLMQQKRELQQTQQELEECYMVNDTTFDGLERKTKILENVDSVDEFHPITTSQIEVLLTVDDIASSISTVGTLQSVEPIHKVSDGNNMESKESKKEEDPKSRLTRGLSAVTAKPDIIVHSEPVMDREGNTVSLLEQKYIIVAGYIRRVLPHLQKTFMKIPSSVSLMVLNFYHQSQLDGVLEDEQLKTLSLDLVNGSDYEFLNFVAKILQGRLKEQIWKKCDEGNVGSIDERRFMFFWIIPVTLFKVAEYQKEHNTKEKPELDNAEIKRECRHLASWIIWRYGTLEDGRFTFKLEQEGYHEKVTEYLQCYVDAQGVTRDRYDNI